MASGKITLTTPKATVEGYIKWSSETGPVTGNYSLVSASIYLRKTDGYTSWGTFSGNLNIAGKSYSFSKNVTLGSSYVLLASKSDIKVNHDSDGTKKITIGANFKIPDTTIAGTYSASKTVTLDTIKRLSYCSGPFDIKAGESFVMNITRYSSSHVHDIIISVDGAVIRRANGYGERITFSSESYQESIFTALNGTLKKDCTIELVTRSGDTVLGSYIYKGTITAKSPGVLGVTLTSAYIGETQGLSVLDPCELYTYRASYDFSDALGVEIPIVGNSSASLPINYIFAQNMPADRNEAECTVTFTAFYGTVPVGTPLQQFFNVKLPASHRVIDFDREQAEYAFLDSHITGSDQKFIHGAGTVRMVIPAAQRAQALYRAYITSYQLKMGEKTVQVSGAGSGDVVLELTGGTGQNLELLITDSRGNSGRFTYEIPAENYIAYSPLQVTECKIYRENGFDAVVKLRIKGTSWKGNFGIAENIVSVKYSVKKAGTETAAVLPDISVTTKADGSFDGIYSLRADTSGSGSEFSIDSAYDIAVTVTDRVCGVTKDTRIESAKIGMYLKRNQTGYQLGVDCRPDDAETDFFGEKAGLVVGGDLGVAGNTELRGNVAVTGTTGQPANLAVNGQLHVHGDLYLDENRDIHLGAMLLPRITKKGDGYIQIDLGTHLLSMNWGKLLVEITDTTKPFATPLSFEPGLFTKAPIITVAGQTSLIGTVVKGVSFSNETKDGCRIFVYRTNTTAFSVHWNAISMTAK